MTRKLKFREGRHLYPAGEAITEPVEMQGVGVEPAILVLSEPLRVIGTTFTARNTVFLYQGTQPGNAVEITNATIRLENCVFAGGQAGWGEEADETETANAGCGLVLKGKTTGTVKACEATWNRVNGIFIGDKSNITLNNNHLTHNGRDGLVFAGESTGTAAHNVCSYNGLNGIAVDGSATPTLYSNLCYHNTWHGLAFYEFAGGVVKANRVEDNGRCGLYLATTAVPQLANNALKNNRGGNLTHQRPLLDWAPVPQE